MGPSIAVEMLVGPDRYEACLAERLPKQLDDEVKRAQQLGSTWPDACRALTPDQLKDLIPM